MYNTNRINLGTGAAPVRPGLGFNPVPPEILQELMNPALIQKPQQAPVVLPQQSQIIGVQQPIPINVDPPQLPLPPVVPQGVTTAEQRVQALLLANKQALAGSKKDPSRFTPDERFKDMNITSEKYQYSKYLSPQILQENMKLARIGTGTQGKLSWKDTYIMGLPHMDVDVLGGLSITDKMKWVKTALETFGKHVTAKNVAAILVCAWHLQSCEDPGEPCFRTFPDMVSTEKRSPTSFETNLTTVTYEDFEVVMPTGDDTETQENWIKAGCYMCAASLRLVTKDEMNLVKSWSHILDQFRNFYQIDIPYKIIPNQDCVRAIRNQLQTRTIFKNTIGVFLLAYLELEGKDQGMCKMLYELHLAHTGMHVYNMITFCSARMVTPIHILISIMTCPSTKPALDTVTYIMLNYDFPETDEEKQVGNAGRTWRYARIFDSEVFAALQTKNCNYLAAVLACVCAKLGSGTAGDVTQIKQLSSYLASRKAECEEIAEDIIEFCTKHYYNKPEFNFGFLT